MKRITCALLAAGLMTTLIGCGGGDSHQKVLSEQAKVVEKINSTLRGIHDAQAAADADPKLRQHLDSMQELSKRYRNLGEISSSDSEGNAAKTKLRDQVENWQKHIDRLASDPAVFGPIRSVLNTLASNMHIEAPVVPRLAQGSGSQTPTPSGVSNAGHPTKGEPVSVKTLDNATPVQIPAGSPSGLALGQVPRNSKLFLQYVKGTWDTYGKKGNTNPDSSFSQGGTRVNLAIIDYRGPDEEAVLLTLVPHETAKTPFAYTINHDVNNLVLRINDRGDFTDNPGVVTYRLLLLDPTGKARDLPEGLAKVDTRDTPPTPTPTVANDTHQSISADMLRSITNLNNIFARIDSEESARDGGKKLNRWLEAYPLLQQRSKALGWNNSQPPADVKDQLLDYQARMDEVGRKLLANISALSLQPKLMQHLQEPAGKMQDLLLSFGSSQEPTGPAKPEPIITAKGGQKKPVGYWKLDETSGKAARDSAGKHPGNLIRGASWTQDSSGAAVTFNGRDGYITTQFAQNLATWTVCALIKSERPPGRGVGGGPVDRDRNFKLNWDHETLRHRGAAMLRVGGKWYSAGFGPLKAKTWYYLTASYDGETLRAYLNGKLVSENTEPSGPPDEEDAWMKMGRHARQLQYWQGSLRQVRIYNRPLPAEEILDLAKSNGVVKLPKVSGAGPKNADSENAGDSTIEPLSHWLLDDQSKTLARDSAGGKHGTVKGLVRLFEYGGHRGIILRPMEPTSEPRSNNICRSGRSV